MWLYTGSVHSELNVYQAGVVPPPRILVEHCTAFRHVQLPFLSSSQDLINQGREKVVEATNSIASARIQPLEDIIAGVVSDLHVGSLVLIQYICLYRVH